MAKCEKCGNREELIVNFHRKPICVKCLKELDSDIGIGIVDLIIKSVEWAKNQSMLPKVYVEERNACLWGCQHCQRCPTFLIRYEGKHHCIQCAVKIIPEVMDALIVALNQHKGR